MPGWPHRDKPPNSESFERYIESLKKYDRDNANVAELVLGVENDGDAPADDIVAEFFFPESLHVVRYEPQIPSKPRPQSASDLFRHTLGAIPPQHLERNETFHFEYNDDYRAVVTIRCKRLMQKSRVAYAVWVHVDNASSGFPVTLRLRVASPPSMIDRQLNVRTEPRTA